MAKQTYVYSGTEWVPLASEVTNLTAYQTKALNQFPNRNLVINGAMQVAQRGTSTASITTTSYNTADRWYQAFYGSVGTWTQSVENDAPTGSGFRKSFKLLNTVADSSLASTDHIRIAQLIEGQNLQHLKKGTASAEQLTVSFWVKSNVTGTYIVELQDVDNTRSVSKSYTVSSSATWEYKTITFPADTTGALDNDNNNSLTLNFWVAAGTSWSSGTLATTWATTTDANRAVGQTNLAAATNNYWQITGVQLEVGDTATPFEFKPYAQDLEQCYRYFQRFDNSFSSNGSLGWTGAVSTGLNGATIGAPTRVDLRAAPSISQSNVQINDYWTNGFSSTGITYWESSPKWVGATVTLSGSFSGRFYVFARVNSGSGYIDVSSEL